MGTDIHTITQVKESGKWKVNEDKIFPNPDYELYERWRKEGKVKKVPDYAKEEFKTEPDRGRNYDWFAILADVRNGIGFAGVETGQGFNIIDTPRGLPEDFEYNEDENDLGYHSFSYLYLSDFEKFDWNQVTMKRGVIPLDHYKELRGINKVPDMYAGAVSGGRIITISTKEADEVLDGKAKIDKKYEKVYVSYEWSIVYREWFQHKIENWVEPLRELSKKYEDVRIIFGFDS